MKFLANENFPLFSIKLLRNTGYSVTSVLEETPGAKDPDILKRACAENCVILTFDRDYGELIYRHKMTAPSGVLYFRVAPSTPEKPAEILLRILQEGNISIEGMFTVVEKNRIRQRTLSKDIGSLSNEL